VQVLFFLFVFGQNIKSVNKLSNTPVEAATRRVMTRVRARRRARIDPNCIRVFYMKKNLRACRFYYVIFSI
jgi:hypothetical protein